MKQRFISLLRVSTDKQGISGLGLEAQQEAREVLQLEGKIFIDRFDQPKPRPEVAIQRDSAIGFARMLRELDLDISAPTDRARPPALASNRAL